MNILSINFKTINCLCSILITIIHYPDFAKITLANNSRIPQTNNSTAKNTVYSCLQLLS